MTETEPITDEILDSIAATEKSCRAGVEVLKSTEVPR